MNNYFINIETQNIDGIIGLEKYSTNIDGIGGVLKYYPEDFEVYEILIGELSTKDYNKKDKIYGYGNNLLCILKRNNIDFFLQFPFFLKNLK